MNRILNSVMIATGVLLILLAKLISLSATLDRLEGKIDTLPGNLPHQSYVDTIFLFEIAYEDEVTDEQLITAIMEVESRGKSDAYNKSSGATGCMQIMPIMVDEVNRICKLCNIQKTYTLDDRWSCEKSKQMFKIWHNFHHRRSSAEKVARHWWGGPKWGEHEISIAYWEKVKDRLGV